MQVRKFEARTMKEALALVKKQMGPDAIILSARDIHRSFGLKGETSVEVTAAVSESTLRKKELAEKKLNSQLRQKFESFPAKKQKEFINKVHEKVAPPPPPTERRPLTSVRYIDIGDEPMELHGGGTTSAQARIQNAAREAFEAAGREFAEDRRRPTPSVRKAPAKESADSQEIISLKNEIIRLKSMIEQFHKVPQTFVTMHPGASYGLSYELSSTFEKLVRAGIADEFAAEILQLAQSSLSPAQVKNPALVDAWVARYLMDNLQIAENRLADRFHVFVGPAGHGKTSSLVKLASHLVICEKKKVAIVTCDSMKVGAADQLRIYAQILNVPFAQVRKRSDWDVICSRLRQFDHIFIDFPGSNLKSLNEIDSLRDLMPPTEGGRSIHYVQSVLAKDSDAFELGQRYRSLEYKDVIFTQLDESVQHGLIYSFQKKFKTPLHSFGIGSNIPEDFEPATKERVIDLIFKLTKIRKDAG